MKKRESTMTAKTLLIILLTATMICTAASANQISTKNAAPIKIRQWMTPNPPDLNKMAGKVHILEFWATWCGPCVQSMPKMSKLAKKYKGQGLVFVALSQDNSSTLVSNLLKKKKVSYHVAMDNGTVNAYNVTGYPTIILVGHDGKVAWRGYPWSLDLEKNIKTALSKVSPPLLPGIDLGPFSKYKTQLNGGKEFAKAYKNIARARINVINPKKARTAKKIIKTINGAIATKTLKADKLKKSKPVKAYELYADLVAKYGGIKATEYAKNACDELVKQNAVKKYLLLAAQPATKK